MHYLNYNEKIQHKTENYPLAHYFVDENHPRYHMPFHWHQEVELIYIAHGQFQLFLNDRTYEAGAGDFFYIKEGDIHGGIPKNCVYHCIVFDFKALVHTTPVRKYTRQFDRRQLTLLEYFKAAQTDITALAAGLCRCLHKQAPGWELSTLGLIYELYGAMIAGGYYRVTSPESDRHDKIAHLKPVLEYIETHYSEPITLQDLSKIAGMSAKYFCRFFQVFIHRTPIDYLNYYRIERACLLLDTSSLSVTEIAYRCGFSDSSYFVRIFKKYKAITPKQYRKKMSCVF